MESTESNREGIAAQQRRLPPIKREPELSMLGGFVSSSRAEGEEEQSGRRLPKLLDLLGVLSR